jgi:hypothetical protein
MSGPAWRTTLFMLQRLRGLDPRVRDPWSGVVTVPPAKFVPNALQRLSASQDLTR